MALEPAPMTYDLCLAWNWEHDADFVALLHEACQEHNVSLLQATPANLATCCSGLANEELAFHTFFDRASDADPEFMPLVKWAEQHAARCINPYERARRAWNKATMHLEFLTAGLHVPYSIILPPFREQRHLLPPDLSALGSTFSIKPACRGGGEGVINAAISWAEALAARQQYPDDPYLLQSNVVPQLLGSRPAWFRVIFCAGEVYCFWWDIATHVYTPLGSDAEVEHSVSSLRGIAQRIAAVCGLQLFSTEIALTAGGQLVVVDYVNDPIDLRLQSKATDGVPDNTVRAIARDLAHWVRN